MTISTLGDIFREHARVRPDKIALTYVDDGRTWTYRHLEVDSNRVANALLAEGMGPRDRVAYLGKNLPEYFVYLMGGAKINAVSVAVNWRLAVPEMEYILNNSEAKVLLVGDEFLEHLSQMNLEHIHRVIVLGDPGETGYSTFDQWIADQPDTDPMLEVSPQDTCYQLYTSGTTGLPKGVELTHDNFMACLSAGLAMVALAESSVNLVCMPLFHISGSGWGVAGMYFGAHSVLLRDVDLDMILDAIVQHAITHSLFVPAVLQFLLSLPKTRKTDFSSLKSITYGASPITEAVL
ncbi:MAG: AMP-binding protein, partial [Pseudomonadales bacterium]